MSAFDTTTNTSSITFTNAWGTAVVHESAANQRVLGFSRNDDKRYFELVVDGDGEDHTNLWMGAWDHYGTGGGGIVVGGSSQRAIIASGANALVPGSASPAFGATPTPGAVFGVAVNFSGDGTRLGGGATVPTASDGHGNLLLPVIYDYFRNNSFITSHVSWDWPSGGFPKRAEPFFLRISNSASDAQVSLRVVTTSFAYAIPTGYIAWGDGPMGAASVTATVSGFPLAWDPLKIAGNVSLSLSDRLAFKQSAPVSPTQSYWNVYSIPLPPFGGSTIGKRVVEFWFDSKTGDSSLFNFGFVDADSPADLFKTHTSLSNSKGYLFHLNAVTRRGVNWSISVTNEPAVRAPGGDGGFLQQFIVDHDTSVFWSFKALVSGWAGTKGLGLTSPYTGVDGLTLTDSLGLRLMWHFLPERSLTWCEINSGRRPFMCYPLMPGVKSYDGTRECLGLGDHWQLGEATLSYAHSNLAVHGSSFGGLNVFTQTTQAGANSTGKKFFQLYWIHGTAGDGFTGGEGGIRLAGRPTITITEGEWRQTSIIAKTYAGSCGSIVYRYGADTLTYTFTGGKQGMDIRSIWMSVAVDFDAGKVWFGLVDPQYATIRWVGGGDPAAGTGWNATFTANTPMVATGLISGSDPGIHFVAEDDNVVDLPAGFMPWNGVATVSATSSPTATTSGAGTSTGNIWPFGIVN